METVKKIFKRSSFIILLIVATTSILSLILYGVLHPLSKSITIANTIYVMNCTLCVVSGVLAIIYLLVRSIYNSDGVYTHYDKKTKEKSKLKKSDIFLKVLPCFLLVLFMIWTAVGCIQASMEASAEAALKDNIVTNDTERNKEIAAWSETDRMPNAGDRSWNGCENLKDGYFSFLFYTTVVLNVVMLGKDSENLKKYIMRTFFVAAFVLVFMSFLTFVKYDFLNGIVKYDRAIFNNSNHYGYFMCISIILSAAMFLKDKNIYFKVMSIISFIVTTFILFLNNTFGAYLGVLCGLIAMAIFTIANIIIKKANRESLIEVIKMSVMVAIFSLYSMTLCGTTLTVKDVSEEDVIVSRNLFVNISGRTYKLSLADGSFVENDKHMKTIADTNFEQVTSDAGKLLDYFSKDEAEGSSNNETSENVNEESESGVDLSKIGSGRGEVWVNSLKLIKQRPVFGWGLENLLNEFYSQFGINEGRTHNLILQLAGTTGIPGMLFYIIGVSYIFIILLTRFKHWGYIEFASVSVFVAYMVNAMFGNSAFYTSPYFMLFLGMMIASIIYYEKPKEETDAVVETVKNNSYKNQKFKK